MRLNSPSRLAIGDGSRRQGFTLVEVSVAAALLAVLLTVFGQMMRSISGQQRAAERRVVALQSVQAIAEEIGNLPWEQVTATTLEAITIPEAMKAYLPEAQLATTIDDEQEPVASTRISIELAWAGPASRPAGRVRLTTWVFPENY